MTDFVICALTNFFRICLIDRFVAAFLGKKEDKEGGGNTRGLVLLRGRKYLVCACFYIANIALFWKFHTAWINILCNLAGISAIVWLYTKSLKVNLFVTFSVYLLNCGCDVAVISLFINYRDGEAYSQIYAPVSVLLIFVCELVCEKVITVRKDKAEAVNFFLILAPILSVVVIGILIYSNTCTDAGLAIVSIGLLVLNFLMLYLYNLLLRSVTEKYEMEMLKDRVQVYANQLDLLRQGEERIKALRHDMKHHLNELTLLANQQDMPKISEYIDRMRAFIQNPDELVASGNMETDSVLNYMLQKARETLRTVDVKVMLPENVVHTFDVNVLLGNLLENAIEAAVQTQQKYLGVRIALKKGVMKIKIENSFAESNVMEKRSPEGKRVFLTTKPLREQHGIGLKNVKKIVEKYDGIMKITRRDGIFCVNLLLYMSEPENGIS